MRHEGTKQLQIVQAPKQRRRLGTMRKARPDQIRERRRALIELIVKQDRPLALREIIHLARGCRAYKSRVVSKFEIAVRSDLIAMLGEGRLRHQVTALRRNSTWVPKVKA